MEQASLALNQNSISQILFQQSRPNEIFIQEEGPQVLFPWPIAIACQFE